MTLVDVRNPPEGVALSTPARPAELVPDYRADSARGQAALGQAQGAAALLRARTLGLLEAALATLVDAITVGPAFGCVFPLRRYQLSK